MFIRRSPTEVKRRLYSSPPPRYTLLCENLLPIRVERARRQCNCCTPIIHPALPSITKATERESDNSSALRRLTIVAA
jgi:hypothetical protein